MRLFSIVGARPQFVKIAPLSRAIEQYNASTSDPEVEHLILHTGQHYDASMSDVFFDELDLPVADFHLGVGSGSHGRQTSAMLTGIERVLEQEQPDLVVVYGDTNSTLAGAVAAAKLHLASAHVESGLRSFNRRMPEEINRVVADHVCDLLLAPTVTAMDNLSREGLAGRSVLVGDLMYDSVQQHRSTGSRAVRTMSRLGLEPGGYGLVTIHRAENTDDPARMSALLSVLNDIAGEGLPLVFPIHPRTASRLTKSFSSWRPHDLLQIIDPVGYLDSLTLLANARVALTDSGGLQKEAFFLGCPCVTLRTETEWVETVRAGANVLADADPGRIRRAVAYWGERHPKGGADFSAAAKAAFGEADSAHRILEALREFVQQRSGAEHRPAGLVDASIGGHQA